MELFWNGTDDIYLRDSDGNVAKLEGVRSIDISSDNSMPTGMMRARIELVNFTFMKEIPKVPEKKTTKTSIKNRKIVTD